TERARPRDVTRRPSFHGARLSLQGGGGQAKPELGSLMISGASKSENNFFVMIRTQSIAEGRTAVWSFFPCKRRALQSLKTCNFPFLLHTAQEPFCSLSFWEATCPSRMHGQGTEFAADMGTIEQDALQDPSRDM